MASDGLSEELRSRMVLALDVDDLVEAVRLAKALKPWFGVAKVGLELFSAAGPDAIGTMHAHGGPAMLRAGVEGLEEGARNAELPTPIALAITVLTSDTDAPQHIVPHRLRVAVEAGCGGIVCAAGDLRDIRTLAPRILRVVPGIRAAGGDVHDQARAVAPAAALAEGADLLVVGRAVTLAEDPAAAATRLFADVPS